LTFAFCKCRIESEGRLDAALKQTCISAFAKGDDLMSDLCRLPGSELDVMLSVWKRGGRASAPEIGDGLGRALTASALHSYLKRLEEKGFLSCEKAGKVNLYTALVSEDDYRRMEGGAVLEKLYDGSLKTFAAALWDGGRLSAEDVSELRSYLDELEGGRG